MNGVDWAWVVAGVFWVAAGAITVCKCVGPVAMSTGATVAVWVGSVVVIAAGWIAITRRSQGPRRSQRAPEPLVEWRRPLNYQIAHAFRVVELRVERFDAEALALCGAWPVAALVPVAELVTMPRRPGARSASTRCSGWSSAANEPGARRR